MKQYVMYRGDTFCKKILANNGYVFQPNDVLRVAILTDTVTGNKIWDDEIKVETETDSIILEIPKEKTAKIEPGMWILEFELTYGGVVKTQQFGLVVKADGIHE